MSPVDRTSERPLWAQVLSDLRQRMETGEFAERFPTDVELISHYGVSRHTVREAVRRLTDEGLVQRERGRGTFVVGPVIEQGAATLYSLFRSVESQGMEQRSEVLELVETTDASVAERLDMAPDAPLVKLSRLRLAAGEPLARDTSWIPADLGRPLLEGDFTHTALYDELATRCGVVLSAGEERIRPIVPDRACREIMGARPGQACFHVTRMTWAGERPVEWRETLVRGDRYEFVSRWSGATGEERGLEPV